LAALAGDGPNVIKTINGRKAIIALTAKPKIFDAVNFDFRKFRVFLIGISYSIAALMEAAIEPLQAASISISTDH
jgi:hypothetical protein